jgi:hypothetical protein
MSTSLQRHNLCFFSYVCGILEKNDKLSPLSTGL